MIKPSQIHEVHGSVVKSFQGCRLQWKWHYVDGYAPLVTPTPLEFGTAFHRAMEALYEPDTWGLPLIDLFQKAKDVFVKACLEQQRTYLNKIEQYRLDPEVQLDFDERVTLGCKMLRKVVKTMNREEYSPVLVEKEAFVPIKDPQLPWYPDRMMYCRCESCTAKFFSGPTSGAFSWEGLPVYYGFRPDAVLVDKEGGYWIVDWKTTSQLLKDQTVLELDGQIGSYCWAIMHSMNLDVRGFLYVQVFKGYPKPPKRLVTPRLGRQYSVSRQQRTDWQTFKQVVSLRDPQAFREGLYKEYINWLRENGPEFVRWFKVFKSQKQLEVIGRDLSLAIQDMLEPLNNIYPNPGRIACTICPFQEPCLERQSGQDPEYLLENYFDKLEPYYILERERREKADA
jgi:hypothetical protein